MLNLTLIGRLASIVLKPKVGIKNSFDMSHEQQGDLRPMLWFFKIFSPKNSAKKLAFLTRNKAELCKKFDHNIGFWEKRHFFRQKLSKIAENCDHNIGPRLGEFSTNVRLLTLDSDLKMTEVAQMFWPFLVHTVPVVY
jgi:hypothetical protein